MTNEELRAIDCRVARAVMGLTVSSVPWPTFKQLPHEQVLAAPQYTRSDADALAALDRLIDTERETNHILEIGATITLGAGLFRYACCISVCFDNEIYEAEDTVALAICLAIVAYLDWRKTHDA